MDKEYISIDKLKHINFQFTEIGNKVSGVSKDFGNFLYVVYDKNTGFIDSIKYDGNFIDVSSRNIQLLNLIYNNKHKQDEISEKHTIDELSNIEFFSQEENGKIIGFNFSGNRLDIICDKNTGIIEQIKIDNKVIKITSENIQFLEEIFPLKENELNLNKQPFGL